MSIKGIDFSGKKIAITVQSLPDLSFAMDYNCRDTLRFLSGITICMGLKIHAQLFGSLSLISRLLLLICFNGF